MVVGYRTRQPKEGKRVHVWKDTAITSREEGTPALTQGEESREARQARTGVLPQAPQGRVRLIPARRGRRVDCTSQSATPFVVLIGDRTPACSATSGRPPSPPPARERPVRPPTSPRPRRSASRRG